MSAYKNHLFLFLSKLFIVGANMPLHSVNQEIQSLRENHNGYFNIAEIPPELKNQYF